MKFSKIAIIIFAMLTAGVAAFAFISPIVNKDKVVTQRLASEDTTVQVYGPPRIAILTPDTIDETTETVSSEVRARDVDGDPVEDDEGHTREVASQYMKSSLDFLSANLSAALTETGRLSIVDPIRVKQVMEDLGRTPNEVEVKEAKTQNISPGLARIKNSLLSQLFEGSRTVSTPSGSRTQTTSRVDLSTEQLRAQMARAAAQELDATYILAVYVSEPRYENLRRDIPDTNRHVRIVRAAPAISYRLFDTFSGTVVLSDVTRPTDPIEIVYEDGQQPLASAFADAQMALGEHIASLVTENIMDTIFPPQISAVDGDLFVIDRGTRDGVQLDDIFEVSRDAGELNQAVGAGNIQLAERVRRPQGSVRVVRVQNTLAYVELLSGGPLVRGDIVEIKGSVYDDRRRDKTTTTQPASLVERAPALGVRMLEDRRTEATTGAAVNKPRIAMREMAIRYIDCGQCQSVDSNGRILETAFKTTLGKESRIDVMSRQDMEALIKERNFSDSAAGRSQRYSLIGMEAAHFLVTGDVAVSPRTQVSTQRVAGKVVETGRTTTLKAVGTISITDPETSRQVASTDVEVTLNGAVSEANLRRLSTKVAQDATAALMMDLFPLAVLTQVSGQQIEISGGRQSGLVNGTRLQVYAVNKQIEDLYSSSVSSGRTLSGTLIVTDVRDDRATARFENKPFAVNRGDLLEILSNPRRIQAEPKPKPTTKPSEQAQPADTDEF